MVYEGTTGRSQMLVIGYRIHKSSEMDKVLLRNLIQAIGVLLFQRKNLVKRSFFAISYPAQKKAEVFFIECVSAYPAAT